MNDYHIILELIFTLAALGLLISAFYHIINSKSYRLMLKRFKGKITDEEREQLSNNSRQVLYRALGAIILLNIMGLFR
ncbi:hypothetical protein [Natranaerobius thermophilus]|uniref:Uncharacterized protein n=1 Tax=Natranaerobius thermophilus (strain ATCC BAA-1301 / DSM 18059 / JW/NM-WN-LF) TaxID=457570 RepID=B2A7S0_NATTJ|nr:hypothetical protein [Natranaerobius thermophilus]ACB84372.1 hypothetical protein Nther_0785 [Natranaerobius thermophilus JW/NM-WN-LF]